jgi:hypothetical protein
VLSIWMRCPHRSILLRKERVKTVPRNDDDNGDEDDDRRARIKKISLNLSHRRDLDSGSDGS